MPRIALSSLILLTSLGLLVACKKEKLENLSVPRLMVETRSVNYGASTGETVLLPVSRTTINIQGDPVVNEFDIQNVEMVKVDMGVALLVQAGGQGARDLYRASVSNMGSRIVFMVNGNAIGARRIDGAIQDGNFYTFVEVDDEELGQLVLDIKETIVELQKNK
jgi:hypothetical protein